MLNPDQSPIPLYHQLADILLEGIRSGEYPPGTRIPSEPQLAKDYGIGRPTVRQAIDVLVRKRLLTRQRGSGTYVRSPEKEIDLFSLAGTSSAFQRQGIDVDVEFFNRQSESR
jgi:GntR family transcriptional regulator